MFVSKLDRPWHETPFPLQGFTVKTVGDLQLIDKFCSHVFVDVEEEREAIERHTSSGPQGSDEESSVSEPIRLPPITVRKPVAYVETAEMGKEITVCRDILKRTYTGLSQLYSSSRVTPELTVDLMASSKSLTESIIRNPNSLLWLSRMENHDSHTYQNALRMTVWALSLGRQMGLSASLLSNLATGCMLSQVGKLSLPKPLLDQEGRLVGAALAQFQSYVNASVDLLKEEHLQSQIVGVVQNHQERHNGQGYPNAVPGQDIPLLAKIAGLAYHFEFLLNPSPDGGQKRLSPTEALNSLYQVSNVEFHEDLIHAFIKSVGLYPVGSQVELSDGHVGVVLSHTPESRLLPRVILMMGPDKTPLPQSRIVDLKALSLKEGPCLSIKRCLPDRTLKVRTNSA